jgi:4-amino-4-deoxy-L-arabinose transferase-like glycosyltransferase
MVAPGFAWAWLDHSVWPWDEAQYAEATLKTLAAFEAGAIPGLSAMMSLLDFRAPGLTWLGVPYAVLGRYWDRPEPALLFATLTWQTGTLLACYFSARLVSQSRLVAVAVAAFVASTPLFIGMNHQFLVEPLQTFAVALSFLLALRAKDMSGEAILLALCAVSALAMAAKVTSPLYCTLPLLYAALVLASRRSITRIRSMPLIRLSLLLCAAAGLVLVSWWYVTNFDATLHHIRRATVGSVVLDYGTPADFPTKLWYWTSAFADAVVVPSPFVLLAAAAGACVGFLLQRRHAHVVLPAGASSDPAARAGWVIAAAAIHMIAALIAYSLQINDDSRFLEPLLPGSAILLAWLCARRWQILASSILLATALAGVFLAYSYTLGLSAPAYVRYPWLWVAERDDSRRRQMQTLVALTCDRGKHYAINTVGVEYSWLSSDSANFYATAAQAGKPDCRYGRLPHAVRDLAQALDALARNRHKYFISVRPEKMPPPDSFNRVSAAVFAKVATSAEWEEAHTVGDTVIFRSRLYYDGLFLFPR